MRRTAQDSELVVIETKDIGPIADAYPALHERLARLHSKRHAKEQQRLAKMLEDKAHQLGVSPQSSIIAKIKEKAEALMEENSARLTAVEVNAAIRIQRVFRGNRFRRAMRLQQNCELTAAHVDPEREAVKLLRSFSMSTLDQAVWPSDEEPETGNEEHAGLDSTLAAQTSGSSDVAPKTTKNLAVEEVARKSWQKLQQSRAEFQQQYREKVQMPRSAGPTDQLAAQIQSLEASMSALQSKDLLHGLEDRVMQALERYFARQNADDVSAKTRKPIVVASDASQWLCSRGLGDLVDVLGTLGSTLSDFTLLSEQDLDALGLKPLTRRRLVRELSQLDGSLLSLSTDDA